LRGVPPASVFIQIAGSNHARRNVLRRGGFVVALVAHFAPIIEAVTSRRVHSLMRQRSSPGKPSLLASAHLNRLSLPGGFALALPNRNDGRIPIRIDVESVIPTLGYRERQVLGVDLINLAAVELADMHIQRALMQLHLHSIVGDVRQSQTAFRANAHHARTQIQLGARVLVSPYVVAVGKRTVSRTLNPIPGPLRLH
jgi:hypothetical protein